MDRQSSRTLDELSADDEMVRRRLRQFRSLNPAIAAEMFANCLPEAIRHGDDSPGL